MGKIEVDMVLVLVDSIFGDAQVGMVLVPVDKGLVGMVLVLVDKVVVGMVLAQEDKVVVGMVDVVFFCDIQILV